MSHIKKVILLIILINSQLTHTILFSILKDLVVGLQVLEEINKTNRNALLYGVKNIVPAQNLPLYSNEDKKQDDETVTFKDLAGNVPIEVYEIVDFLREPEKYAQVGAQMPKGILLYGPPGTGKTSIAKALSNEANAHFFSGVASSFVQIYVGVGPKSVRELFDQAKQALQYGTKKAAIVFIDEIDCIGRARTGDTNQEYQSTLNELLNQMEGFDRDPRIIVIGATNFMESLDPALLRPGRFDRHIYVGLPNDEGRLAIIKLYAQRKNLDKSVDLTKYIPQTKNWSPAELKNFVNEAAIRAARDNSLKVREKHFDQAIKDEITRKRKTR